MKLSLLKNRSSKGKAAEKLAENFLSEHGLTLIESNFSCRYGEIDLIMQHEQALVFVEVRYRKNQQFGGAAASVTANKQNKIIKTALFYMQKKGQEFNTRFDVIAISDTMNDNDIQWIKNAF